MYKILLKNEKNYSVGALKYRKVWRNVSTRNLLGTNFYVGKRTRQVNCLYKLNELRFPTLKIFFLLLQQRVNDYDKRVNFQTYISTALLPSKLQIKY